MRVKAAVAKLGPVLLLSLAFATLAFLISPLSNWRGYPRYRYFCPGNDFMLRMNEISCVLQGCDPLDILNGVKTLEPYGFDPGLGGKLATGPRELISAYPPWEYSFMMPLAALPSRVAWGVYVALMFAGMTILYVVSSKLVGPAVASLALLFSAYPIWSNFFAGNFAVPILFAAFLMAYALNRGRDVLAGVCWAVMMVKPQLGMLFAIPLLWRRKFTTCFVAAAICLAASLVPAWMCSSSPLKMIFLAPSANTGAFSGCGTMPWCCCGYLSRNVEIFVGCAIGFLLCLGMTWCLRREKDWFWFLMPAAVCAPTWTYTQSCSFALGWFFFFVLLREVGRNPRSAANWTFLALAIPVFSRLYVACNNLMGFCRCSSFVSPNLNLVIDSLNSTASIVLAGIFCLSSRKKATDALEGGRRPPTVRKGVD